MAVRFTSDCGQPGFVSNSQGKLSEQSRKRYEDKYAQHYVYTEHQIYEDVVKYRSEQSKRSRTKPSASFLTTQNQHTTMTRFKEHPKQTSTKNHMKKNKNYNNNNNSD